MAKEYPDHPWIIRRNGNECAKAATRSAADRIVAQLSKIHRNATWVVQYDGKSLSHCGYGGKAL